MSATRSRCRKGPAISPDRRADTGPAEARPGIALLLAGHGAPRHAAAQETICAHAAALAGVPGIGATAAGFLAAAPGLAEAAASLAAASLGAGPLHVMPMFMADGFLVRTALPRALGRPVRVLTPLGLLPGLTAIIARRALALCGEARLDPARTTLLLVGHGSANSPASREAVAFHAARLARDTRLGPVATAFLEEPPLLADALLRLEGHAVVAGFFAAPGVHASEDVPALLDAAPRAGQRRLLYTGAIGADPEIVELVAATVRADLMAEAGQVVAPARS
ncbi:MAG: hypothetical protein IT557_13025 [Alphaproteobacteria bacterium]|nr:hypothetical protein [Alphaproteobacteria bacterium]